MIDVTELLAMKVNDRAEAEAFIEKLFEIGLGHHFDDGAVDCLHGNGLVTLREAEMIDGLVADCYSAWEATGVDMMEDCPIGHALKCLEKSDAGE